MIVLVTDFGNNGPYVGQMKAAIYQQNSAAIIIDLFANAPGFNPRACSYILSAYASYFPVGTVFLCVVDPGVGTKQRKPVVVEADGCFFVGPDNGLFDVLAKQSKQCNVSEILWRPEFLSTTFHGRDLFAPIAAHISLGGCPDGYLDAPSQFNVDDVTSDLFELIYIDDYGNGMTGIRAYDVSDANILELNGFELHYAQTFAAVEKGKGFWYENSVGLIEVAVNCGNAATDFDLQVGDPVTLRLPC